MVSGMIWNISGSIIPIKTRSDFHWRIAGGVGEGVDVGRQAGRRGRVDASDMVVYADLGQLFSIEFFPIDRYRTGEDYLLGGGRLGGLLDEMDEIRRTEFPKRLEAVCSNLDHGMRIILEEPAISIQHTAPLLHPAASLLLRHACSHHRRGLAQSKVNAVVAGMVS